MPVVGQISVGDGATFTPSVSNSGVISWTNDKNLPNPASVDIADVVQTAISGVYLPTAGGTVTGNLTVNGTLTGNLSGNATTATTATTALSATTATSATNDGNGNEITSTYLPLGGGTLTGNLTENNDLIVNGNANLNTLSTTGDATVGGDFDVVGNSTLASVSVSGNTTVTDLTADNITVTNDLSVTGSSTFTGNITAGADVTVTGDLSANDITASGDITADDVTANGNLSVVGNATLSGTSTAVTPAAEDNSTKIATTQYVQTEIKPIEVNADIVNKRVTNIEKLLQGNLYDYQTDTDSKYTKTVPQGAMPYASLDSIGGKTVVWNQLVGNGNLADATGWGAVSGTLSVNNNEASVTAGSSGSFAILSTSLKTKTTIGHKYYVHCETTSTIQSTFAVSVAGAQTTGNIINFGYTNPNVWRVCSGFLNPTLESAVLYFRYNRYNDAVYSFKHIKVIDLTLMFGAGNEPSTTEEVEAMFPADWYTDNTGQLLSAGVTEVKSVGVNLFDPNAITDNKYLSTTTGLVEPNNSYCVTDYIPVNAGQTIYIPDTYTARRWLYDVDKNPIEYLNNSNEQYYVPTRSGYIRVSINKISVDVNGVIIAYSTTIPTYVPYNGHTYPIPAAIQALEGYGWSAGSVYNYIDYERKVFVQRVASVDMGTLNWDYSNVAGHYRFYANVSGIKSSATYTSVANVVTPLYTTVSPADIYDNLHDKTVAVHSTADVVWIYDSAYTNKTTFKTAMDGVMLYYELATPIETDISAYLTDDNLIEVESGGSLTFPNSNGTDYQIPVPSSETYMVDLQASL